MNIHCKKGNSKMRKHMNKILLKNEKANYNLWKRII